MGAQMMPATPQRPSATPSREVWQSKSSIAFKVMPYLTYLTHLSLYAQEKTAPSAVVSVATCRMHKV